MQADNHFKGFSLFSDIEDVTLRNRNRAVVLANIAVDYMNRKTKMVSPKGAGLILGYFQKVPEADRADVQERFKQRMFENGFRLS